MKIKNKKIKKNRRQSAERWLGWAMLLDKDNAEDEEGAVSSSASPSRPRHGKLATGQRLLTLDWFHHPDALPLPQGTIAPVHPPRARPPARP